MRRLPGLVKIVLVGSVVAVVAYASLYLRWPVERPLAYWSIDDTTLGILVGDSPDLGCAVAFVDESTQTVTVHTQCWERVIPVPQAAVLQPYAMEVTLQAPLGSRSVFGGNGNPAQLCQSPYPNCTIPG